MHKVMLACSALSSGFQVTTITTTGYGDISAHTTVEEVAAIVIMLCGALLLSFLIGTMAGMLNENNPQSQRAELYRQKLLHLDR
jgi:hypothetical protein